MIDLGRYMIIWYLFHMRKNLILTKMLIYHAGLDAESLSTLLLCACEQRRLSSPNKLPWAFVAQQCD